LGGRIRTEVFELDEDFGEHLCHSIHEFVHEFIHFFIAYALLATAKVEGILEVFGVIGTELKREEWHWLLRFMRYGGVKTHV
jgi:hypothetical protein